MSENEWTQNWESFIRCVAADIDDGMTAVELSRKYSDIPVEWTGKVIETRLNDDMPCVKLTMPAIDIELQDGRRGKVDYIALQIDNGLQHSWKSVSVSNTIRFRTQISESFGPFDGLQWADIGDRRGYIEIATHQSQLLEII